MTDFEEIYRHHAPQIYRVCMGYTNDADLANDLVQESNLIVTPVFSTSKRFNI